MVCYFFGVLFITPTFKATSKLLISAEKQVNKDLYYAVGFVPKMEISATPAEILISEPVLEPVVKALNLYQQNYEFDNYPPLKKKWMRLQAKLSGLRLFSKKQPDKNSKSLTYQKAVVRLRNSISAAPVLGSRILKVSVSDINPEVAARIVNAVVRSYVIYDIRQQLAMLYEKYGEKHPIVRPLLEHIALLERELGKNRLSDTDAIGPGSLKIIEQASIPFEPSGISRGKLLLLTIVTGIFISLAFGFAFEYLDQTIKSPDEAESLLALPVLGVFNGSQKIVPAKLHHMHENAAQQIHLMLKPDKGNCLVFAGASPHDDAESAVIACSRVFAQTLGMRTLLINANFRSSPKNDLLMAAENPGLTSLVKGTHPLEEVIIQADTQFWILPAGDSDTIHPSILFHAKTLPELLVRIRGEFDIVFINAPDVISFSDASALSKIAGQVVLVVAERRTRRRTILKSLDLLHKTGAPLLGAMVVNHADILPSLLYKRL